MPNIGPMEIAIVLIVVLLIFGPKRLPDLGRSLGTGMREFKDSVTGKDKPQKAIEPAGDVTVQAKGEVAVQAKADDDAPAAAAKPADVS